MNNSQNDHILTNEFDDVHISISLLAGTMRLYVQTPEEEWIEQAQAITIVEFVELVREFHNRVQAKAQDQGETQA